MADGNIMMCCVPRCYQRQASFMDALYLKLHEKYQYTNGDLNNEKLLSLRNVYYNVSKDFTKRNIFSNEFDQETLLLEVLENDEYEKQSEIITGVKDFVLSKNLEDNDGYLSLCLYVVDIFFKEQPYYENVIEAIILLYEEMSEDVSIFDYEDERFSRENIAFRNTAVEFFINRKKRQKAREDNKDS